MLLPKTYDLLDRCVGDGIAIGYNRAHKHDSRPDEYTIRECIHREVMNEICEWFDISDPSETVLDSSKLPIGVPVMTPDGKIVVNVGEGGGGGITKDVRRSNIEKAMEDAFKDGIDLSGRNTP